MHKKSSELRVSIVIPVYNESQRLAACLDSIACQTVKPFEVIVVDNNSTDDTAEIAENYRFVTLIHEPRQGVIHARNSGFDAAHGDIIGRIDADTILSSNWVETVKRIMADRSLSAISGTAMYHDIAWQKLTNWVDARLRRHLARMLGKHVGMQGANLAMRRSAWRKVRSEVCHCSGIHEDLDLGIHLSRLGMINRFEPSMVASISFRQAASPFLDYVRYLLLNPRTYALHGERSRIHMYPVVWLAIIMLPVIRIAYFGYNPLTGGFSIERLLAVPDEAARVNPATFVD